MCLRLGLGLGLTVTGTGLGASDAGRGNALASSRGARCRDRSRRRSRRRRRRCTASGFRASSCLGGARNGGGPSRFNQVLLRSVVWFGRAPERHYHNKENGAGRAPAETGGPLFRNTGCFWSCVASQSVSRSRKSQSRLVRRFCACWCWVLVLGAALRSLLPSESSQSTHRSSFPRPQKKSDEQSQTKPRPGKAAQSSAKQGRAGQDRAGQHDSKQGPGWAVVTVLSLARSWLALTRREIRAQRDRRDLDGSCV